MGIEPANELIDSIVDEELTQLLRDDIEPIIDSFLTNELVIDVVTEIPLLNKIINTAKFGIKIKNWFFAKKIRGFLLQLERIDLEKRKKFVQNLEIQKKRREVGETLIIILDRLDHIIKADMIGKIFKAYILEKITYDTFIMLANIIERVFITDLKSFLKGEELDRLIKERFYSLGIFSMNIIDAGKDAIIATYSINELGKQLFDLLK